MLYCDHPINSESCSSKQLELAVKCISQHHSQCPLQAQIAPCAMQRQYMFPIACVHCDRKTLWTAVVGENVCVEAELALSMVWLHSLVL